jgi:hypothetical protein
VPAPQPAVSRASPPGLAFSRLTDVVWFCCALLPWPPWWLPLPEVAVGSACSLVGSPASAGATQRAKIDHGSTPGTDALGPMPSATRNDLARAANVRSPHDRSEMRETTDVTLLIRARLAEIRHGLGRPAGNPGRRQSAGVGRKLPAQRQSNDQVQGDCGHRDPKDCFHLLAFHLLARRVIRFGRAVRPGILPAVRSWVGVIAAREKQRLFPMHITAAAMALDLGC